MTQQTVKDIYLRVIEQTIEDSRKGFTESGEESILDSLDMLAERWRSRVLAFDFTEDPGMIPKASGSSRSASAAASAASTGAAAPPPAPAPLPAPVDTGTPAKAEPVLSGQQQRPYVAPVYRGVPPPPLAAPMEPPAYPPEFHPGHAAPPAKAEPVLPPAPDGRVPQGDAPGDERPAKRARTENGNVSHKFNSTHDDDHIGAEDLDSSGDSDVQSAGSDPEADNYILAQHDRVRKGTGKWKVQLKEGIAHINGRDYLFNKATCDLDW